MERDLKKFIKNIIKRIFVFALIMVFTSSVAWFLTSNPLIANKIAMGQMNHSDDAYLFLMVYNLLKPMFNIIYFASSIWFVGTLTLDTYKFFTVNDNIEINKEI
jgi:hypothetical protein